MRVFTSLCICIGIDKYAAIFSCSTSNMKSSEEIRDKFYSELGNQLRITSTHIRRLGNFYARVGYDTSVWSSFFSVNMVLKKPRQMVIYCYLFVIKMECWFPTQTSCFLSTTKQVRFNNYHIINYMVVKSSSRKEVKIARPISIGGCWIDHRSRQFKDSITINSSVRNNWTQADQLLDAKKLDNTGLKYFRTFVRESVQIFQTCGI